MNTNARYGKKKSIKNGLAPYWGGPTKVGSETSGPPAPLGDQWFLDFDPRASADCGTSTVYGRSYTEK